MNSATTDTAANENIMLSPGIRTIGRATDNDIVISDQSVSSYHAKIVTFFEASYIEDLDSSNGTYVNGKQVKKHIIRPGDNVFFGNRIYSITSQEKY